MRSTASGGGSQVAKALAQKPRRPGDGKFPPVPYDGTPGYKGPVGKPKNRSFQATNDLKYRSYS